MKNFFKSLLLISVIATMASCDKDVCRECYVTRSALAHYTDTTLADYLLIDGDTVKSFQDCDKEDDFKNEKQSFDKYEYDSKDIFFTKYHVHISVTDKTTCPEQQTDSIN